MIATDLTPPHETINKIGRSGHAFQLDVTKEEDWRSVFLKSQELGDVDIVINNAGYFPNVRSMNWTFRRGERPWPRIWTPIF